jgi:hypothetical protein
VWAIFWKAMALENVGIFIVIANKHVLWLFSIFSAFDMVYQDVRMQVFYNLQFNHFEFFSAIKRDNRRTISSNIPMPTIQYSFANISK